MGHDDKTIVLGMMEPLPKPRSICEIAASSAFSLSIPAPSTRRSATFNMRILPYFTSPLRLANDALGSHPSPASRSAFNGLGREEKVQQENCTRFVLCSQSVVYIPLTYASQHPILVIDGGCYGQELDYQTIPCSLPGR